MSKTEEYSDVVTKEFISSHELNKYKRMSGKDFLSGCTACGGAWTAMLFTGMRRLFPEVYDEVPGDVEFSTHNIMEILSKVCNVHFNA